MRGRKIKTVSHFVVIANLIANLIANSGQNVFYIAPSAFWLYNAEGQKFLKFF